MGAATASTTPLRSNLRSGSNHLVLSLFFFSSVLLMQMPKGNAALDPEEESVVESLQQRFNQLNGTGDPCLSRWVICSIDSAHVEGIYLYERGLKGTIPADFAKLRHIKFIFFDNNPNLRGSIPNLSEMVGLTILDISYCGLSGLLPGLESSTELTVVDLQSNDFSGSIPHALFEHPTLEFLHLSNNPKLSGEIPDMSQMSNINDFQAFNCNFEGPLPNMKASTKLGMIDVSNNKLHGNLPELPAGSAQSDPDYRLHDLNFTNNNFSGEIPMSWTELIFLRTMRLDNNGLSGYIPVGLGGLTNLQELNLSSNNFSGPIPNEFGLLKNLRSIDLRNNLFDNIPEALASLPNLTTIRLENNKFTALPEALIQKYKDGLVYLTWDNNTMVISENSTAKSNLNTTMTSENSTAKTNLSTGAIVGIATGSAVLVAFVVSFIMCDKNRRRKKKNTQRLPREEVWNPPSNSRAAD